MCIAIHKPASARIGRKTLYRCWERNNDGAGFAYAHGGKLHVRKGYLTWPAFYNSYRAAREKYPDEDFIIHFRIATSGPTDPANTHPFRCGNVAIIHNGVIATQPIPKDSPDSDTALFVRHTLGALPDGWMDDDGITRLLEHFAYESRSKFVAIDNRGEVRIYGKDLGEYHNGVWFSNGGFKKTFAGFGRYGAWEAREYLPVSGRALGDSADDDTPPDDDDDSADDDDTPDDRSVVCGVCDGQVSIDRVTMVDGDFVCPECLRECALIPDELCPTCGAFIVPQENQCMRCGATV